MNNSVNMITNLCRNTHYIFMDIGCFYYLNVAVDGSISVIVTILFRKKKNGVKHPVKMIVKSC